MEKVRSLYSNEVTLEDNRIMKLEYNMTENIVPDSNESYYGIQIIKIIDNNLEREEIRGISYSKDKVEAITRILYQNVVTPISMVEIVDDLITLEDM
ncbi:MAG: hypothetical protein GX321_07910 [Clostridiales bacterium]|nr:hypothetical protein [Clostridiales bacterium]